MGCRRWKRPAPFIASQTGTAFGEYVAASPDGRSILPMFGGLLVGEDLPKNGKLTVSSAPGFGMTLSPGAKLEPG